MTSSTKSATEAQLNKPAIPKIPSLTPEPTEESMNQALADWKAKNKGKSWSQITAEAEAATQRFHKPT